MAQAIDESTTSPPIGGVTIMQLARDHAAIQVVVEREEDAARDSSDPCVKMRSKAAQSLLHDRSAHIESLILTMRPTHIQDVTAQLHFAAQVAANVAGNIMTDAERDGHADTLERVLLSSVGFVAEAAGMDLAALDWTSDAHLADHRFGAVEVGQ